jgi:hypothetical protein
VLTSRYFSHDVKAEVAPSKPSNRRYFFIVDKSGLGKLGNTTPLARASGGRQS